MKQTIFTLLLLSTLGLISCRKTEVEKDIKQFDQEQIESYISTNGLTGMQRDVTGGDTSGIYYKIILPGNGVEYKYTDSISFIYTLKSFDGLFNSLDTLANHYSGYVGHIERASQAQVPLPLSSGLQLVVRNVLKKGGSIRVLIPSRLAFGVKGFGAGSNSTSNTKIAGNQCIDYYIHAIADQKAYDDEVIVKYIAANNLTGYQKAALGYYYKINTPGTGTTPITDNTVMYINYVASLLNGKTVDLYATGTTGTPFEVPGLIAGVREAAKKYCTTGTNISLLLPSRLAYGTGSNDRTPPISCFRFDMVVISTTP
jgi:FKBP-type peptidyl-prolyl cis-trans isomerase FkpA